MNKNLIEVGDLVRLKQPYKVNDYHHDKTFLAALNGGIYPDSYSNRDRLYHAWTGFTHGVVHEILTRKQNLTPHKLALYLYYPIGNGLSLSYSLPNQSPLLTCVDFVADEVELIFKSSAPDYGSGTVYN